MKDFVLFPTMALPLFVAREKTKHALDQAFHSEIVLVTQRDEAVEEPGFSDVYEVGVLARLLELERLPDGTMKIIVQAHRRVVICRFMGEAGAKAIVSRSNLTIFSISSSMSRPRICCVTAPALMASPDKAA
jgi:ATP-dependent Lon protease